MKRYKYLFSIVCIIILSSNPIPLFSQGQSTIYDIKLDDARWSSDGSVILYGSFKVRNPATVWDYDLNDYGDWFSLGYKINGDDRWQGSGNMVKQTPTYEQHLGLKVKKQFTDINSTQQIIIKTMDNGNRPNNIEKNFYFKIIEENGYKKVAGIQNHNSPKTGVSEGDKATQVPNIPSVAYSKTEIEIEKNNTTGVPYKGVVADGTSSIRINLRGISGDRVKFEIPYGMGYLKYKGGIQAINEPKIDQYISLSNGSATVFFHPPQYPAPSLMANKIAINERQVNCINAPIKFSYKDAVGATQSSVIKISILRPMVFLVHGFTGDASTWAGLAGYLTTRKFDCRAENYYALNDDWGYLKKQDVFAQSRKLSENIDNAKKEYSASGVKMLKVDVVSHSMGGLIARYYAHGYSEYRNDVRKLFMVGTPNHGIGDGKQLLGAFGSIGSWSHFGMLSDVHEESVFMKNLNKNETTGGHLNANVEYYNIFGTVDDGVTSESSAYIPGILYTRIRDCCHSPSPSFLSKLGTPLTIHRTVYNKVGEYLQTEIMRLPLKKVKATIIQNRGEVWVDNGTGNKLVKEAPYTVSIFDKIRTREKSSITISFTVDGKEWGRLVTGQNTSLQLKNYSPQTFTVRVVKGKARFSSSGSASGGSHFQVEIMPDNYSKLEWYTFSPKVDINGLGTIFEVIYENGVAKINLIEGEIRLDNNYADTFDAISTPQTIMVAENGQTSSQTLQIDTELKQLDTGGAIKSSTNPLFSNVTIGGTNIIGSSGNNTQVDNSVNTTGSCLGQLKVSFIIPLGGSPANQQQQFQMKAISDRNNLELRWFQQAEKAFKSGIMPKELTGTYRPDASGKAGAGKYYSETVTLFKPMKILGTDGNSIGFRIVSGVGRRELNFPTKESAKGIVLPCGSYKLYVDPNDNIDKTWVTITFSNDDKINSLF